jgi:hypothetical protein
MRRRRWQLVLVHVAPPPRKSTILVGERGREVKVEVAMMGRSNQVLRTAAVLPVELNDTSIAGGVDVAAEQKSVSELNNQGETGGEGWGCVSAARGGRKRSGSRETQDSGHWRQGGGRSGHRRSWNFSHAKLFLAIIGAILIKRSLLKKKLLAHRRSKIGEAEFLSEKKKCFPRYVQAVFLWKIGSLWFLCGSGGYLTIRSRIWAKTAK